MGDAESFVTIPRADYERLLDAATADSSLFWCDQCGAWFDHAEDGFATTEGFDGCWYAATAREADAGTCRKDQRRRDLPEAARAQDQGERE